MPFSVPGEPLFVPWPDWPTLTATGRVSEAHKAGKAVPWLSKNVVNTMHMREYHNAKNLWLTAGKDAAEADGRRIFQRITLAVVVAKRTAHVMDSLAVLEGCKDAIDGLVTAGLLAGDDPNWVMGGFGESVKANPRGIYFWFIPTDQIRISGEPLEVTDDGASPSSQDSAAGA